MLLSFPLLLLLLPLLTLGDKVAIYHRIYHPLLEPVPYSLRGHVSISAEEAPVLEHAASFSDDLASFAEILEQPQNIDGAFYQLALQTRVDTEEDLWDFSSVKACHLASSSAELIIIHLQDSGLPYALDYFVSPIPHSGTCPKLPTSGTDKRSASFTIPSENLTISIRTPNSIPLPRLKVPPQLSPQGEPVVAEPEKSFIQKYWMYIVAGLVILLFAGPDAPEEAEGARGGSQASSAAR